MKSSASTNTLLLESDTSPANKAIDLTSDAESQSGPSTSSSNSPLKYSIEKMKRQQRRTKVKGKHVTNSGDESGSDDDGSPVTKRTRLLESSESDDSDVMPRKRRRVIRGNVPPLPEGEELLKELELESEYIFKYPIERALPCTYLQACWRQDFVHLRNQSTRKILRSYNVSYKVVIHVYLELHLRCMT